MPFKKSSNKKDMITLVSRETVFAQHKNIATEISEMQKAFYDEDYLALCDNEQERKAYLDLFDIKDLSFPKINTSYKVTAIDHDELKTYTKTLADRLKKLFLATGIESFFVMAHLNTAFIGNTDNKYPPLQKAFKKFQNITGDINYNEVISIDMDDLGDLVDIAFWIARCDASAPEYTFFHDAADRLSFNICKHGNIHLLEYEKEILPHDLLQQFGWLVMDNRCYDKFTTDGRIKGRRIKI
ncbi:MAG TPA: hypothetical protein PKM63_03980 [Panacibacter sp.]|nr:hypothetical protein [Panacibacter sp.]